MFLAEKMYQKFMWSRRESLPAGRQACPPLVGNLYQKFRKLPCLPEVDILSIPACRQAGNYGTRKIIR
jgi:hypothetical protein